MTPPQGARLRLCSADITWEQFEQFFLALVDALPEVASANRYGTSGDDQEGIDHEIAFADGTTGAAQCRQRDKFGKPQFDEAVSDNDYAADQHIVATSGVATQPARKAAAATPGWELWDVDDIGVKVRSLPRVDARWLVEDHLGAAQRRAFLGPEGGLTLSRWRQRFRRLLEPDRLFSHTLPLVGRDPALAELNAFLSDPRQQIAILPGRGGGGKTRLLLEFGRSYDTDKRPILFVGEGASLTAQTLDDELPAGAAVLVLDDAHRGDGARVAIGYVESHPEVKLVLAARPHGRDELVASALVAGFDRADMAVLEGLEPLDQEASRTLAREALPDGSDQVIEALGDTTRDCQLITVLAARLLAKGEIPLALLANEDQLRDEVLSRFRDEMLGFVPDTVPCEQLRRLLPIVAGVQPVRDESRELFARAAAALHCEEHDVVIWLDELERAGLLLRAGGLRRLTPDVLGDFVLERPCVGDRGTPTGYAEWLWQSFAEVAADRLLVNLSELDWRIRAGAGASTLFDPVWSRVRAEYQAGHGLVRFRLLGLLEPIAIMQPERVLELGELELRAPAETHVDNIFAASWSAEDVGRKLAPLVRDAGRHPQHTRRAMRLLWMLGRDDGRPQAQNLDHSLRLLGELGSYESGHPAFCEALLDIVEEQMATPDGHEAAAVTLLGSVMVREVLTTRGSGRRQFALEGHFIDRKATAAIRMRAIGLLRGSALSGGERAAAAITVIAHALRVPFGFGGGGAPKEVVDQWRPEQRQLLGVLAEVLEVADGSLAAQVREVLRDEAEYARWPASRKRAKKILDEHPPDLIAAVVHAIVHPWSSGLDGTAREQIAGAVITESTDPECIAAVLNEALGQVRGNGANPLPLLGDLARASPELATGLVQRVFDHPDELLTAYLGVLGVGREPGLTDRLWRDAHVSLRRLAASVYAMNSSELDEKDAALLRGMLVDGDDEIRSNAVLAVIRMGQAEPALMLDLASGAAPRYGQEIDHLLHGVSVAHATDDQLVVFLGWVEDADHLSWQAGEFIRQAAPRAAQRVMALLINRARDGRDIVGTGQLQGLLNGLTDADYATALRTLREAALNRELAGRLAYLVDPIVRGDGSELVGVLLEWLVDPYEARVRAVCSLVRQLSWQIIFDQHARFAAALDVVTVQHRDRAVAAVRAAATGGGTMRGFGVAAPQDVTRRQRAEEIALSLAEGSVGRALFSDLAVWFAQDIEADLRRDEEEDLFGR
ncbi:MAG TPA: hypothetical protein VIJ33_07095 [Solirubrobacteraceae bacterium]